VESENIFPFENIFPLRVIRAGVRAIVVPPETINRNGIREGAWCHLARSPKTRRPICNSSDLAQTSTLRLTIHLERVSGSKRPEKVVAALMAIID